MYKNLTYGFLLAVALGLLTVVGLMGFQTYERTTKMWSLLSAPSGLVGTDGTGNKVPLTMGDVLMMMGSQTVSQVQAQQQAKQPASPPLK